MDPALQSPRLPGLAPNCKHLEYSLSLSTCVVHHILPTTENPSSICNESTFRKQIIIQIFPQTLSFLPSTKNFPSVTFIERNVNSTPWSGGVHQTVSRIWIMTWIVPSCLPWSTQKISSKSVHSWVLLLTHIDALTELIHKNLLDTGWNYRTEITANWPRQWHHRILWLSSAAVQTNLSAGCSPHQCHCDLTFHLFRGICGYWWCMQNPGISCSLDMPRQIKT